MKHFDFNLHEEKKNICAVFNSCKIQIKVQPIDYNCNDIYQENRIDADIFFNNWYNIAKQLCFKS